MSIPEYADAVLMNSAMNGTTPVEIAQSLWELSTEAMRLTKVMSGNNNKELGQTINDINAMSTLGIYYSNKISGAVNKCIADKVYDPKIKTKYKNAAIENLKEASLIWRDYSERVDNQYYPHTLTRMIPNEKATPGLPRYTNIKELQTDVDNDILLATRI